MDSRVRMACFLPVQRQMIVEFIVGYFSQQSRSGQALVDDLMRHFGDGGFLLTGSARVLYSNMLNRKNFGRHDVNLFADLFAEGLMAMGASDMLMATS